jgi:hypothetical protein
MKMSHNMMSLTDEQRAWLCRAMHELLRLFGRATLLDAEVVLPNDDYFPDEYEPTVACVWNLARQLCGYLRLDPDGIELEFYQDRPHLDATLATGMMQDSGTAGLYIDLADHTDAERKAVIGLEVSTLNRPPVVVATLAHELGHVLLAKAGIGRGRPDLELLTDLVPLYHGLGLLTASAAFHFAQFHDARVSGWRVGRHGYLSEPMYGYAFAAFAYMRGEGRPAWARELPLNIRTCFKRELKALQRAREAPFPRYRRP